MSKVSYGLLFIDKGKLQTLIAVISTMHMQIWLSIKIMAVCGWLLYIQQYAVLDNNMLH
jgi:hypothetical protein